MKDHAAFGEQLSVFEINASGTGIRWPELDEDLSLKGFLTQELRNLLLRGSGPLAA